MQCENCGASIEDYGFFFGDFYSYIICECGRCGHQIVIELKEEEEKNESNSD